MEEVKLQEELQKTRRELLLLYEIGNLIRTTLLLDEVIYLILSAVTSHEGLGYNRAVLFMVDETGTALEGKMGIGPTHPAASPQVWKMIKENKITLEGLLDVYRKANKKIDAELNELVRQSRIPIRKDHGTLARIVLEGNPFVVSGEKAREELAQTPLKNLDIAQFAAVPLRGKNRVIGVMLIDNITTKKEVHETDVRRLMMLANHAGLALENAQSFNQVMIHSQQDSLTKLWNHAYFEQLLQESIKESKLNKKYLSLIVFDVDDFKSYNDTYGHQAGDKILAQISEIAKTVMRRHDQLSRYGGEEFAAVLPGTTKLEAVKLAGRLCIAIQAQTSDKRLRPTGITISAGVASYPEDAEEKEKLIFCADGALYEAKRDGKNTVKSYKKSD